jgi:hypothetical protein
VSVVARHRTTILLVVVALLVIVASAWLGRGHRSYGAALDPGNPDGDGARAVARVLGGQGVDVRVVRSAAALAASPADASTTIVVTSAGNLGRSTTGRLLAHQGAARLVVVSPGPELVRQLGLPSEGVEATLDGPVVAGCPAYDGLSLDVPDGREFAGPGCFRGTSGVLLAAPRPGLTLVGAPAALTNDQVLDGDNAAVALRLLGGTQRLVWYVPSLADLAGSDSVSASSLLPRWLVPGIWLVLAGLVATALWRGRRLGPLASEPLPVSVKAIETTRNLGRLYRSAGDRTHAAETLRASARARLADRLGLPRRADPETLVRAVAARTGRPESDVAVLLAPDAPPPVTDPQLTDLALVLSELDTEVSRP